jgi:hypothetical protein
VEAEHDRGDEHQVTPLELFCRTIGAVLLLALIPAALATRRSRRSPW